MGHDGGLRTDCPVGSLSPDPPSLSCFRLVCPSGGFACVEASTWSAYCGPYIPDISANLDNVGTTAYMDREGVIAMVAQVRHAARSEERGVGKECVSTCRSRWSPKL